MNRTVTKQVELFDAPAPTATQPLWLLTDDRALLKAAQREWIVPGDRGLTLVKGTPPDGWSRRSGTKIGVAARLMSSHLPERKGDHSVTYPLPLSAVQELAVSDNSEARRLRVFLQQFANIPEFDFEIVVNEDISADRNLDIADPGTANTTIERWDAHRGAMAMMLWSLPRIAPWLDLLVSIQGHADTARLGFLGCPWLRDLPWNPARDIDDDFQSQLWRAAWSVFEHLDYSRGWRPVDVLSQLVAMLREAGTAHHERLEEWRRSTLALLDAKTVMSTQGWRQRPVECALQLLLLRETPERFVSWAGTGMIMPPAVWVSGALLSGLLMRYPRLLNRFRGEAAARRLVALHCMPNELGDNWPGRPENAPSWRYVRGQIELRWGEHVIDTRSEHARSRWYRAELNRPESVEAALRLAAHLGWRDAVRVRLTLTDTDIVHHGSGSLKLTDSAIRVQGQKQLLLPSDVDWHRELDIERFRRKLAVEGIEGSLPEPPQDHSIAQQLDRGRQDFDPAIAGLRYVPNFLSPDQQRAVLSQIDAEAWMTSLKRRVQHYGWRYDYKARRIDRSMRLGALPKWAEELAERLYRDGFVAHVPDQVIVNEYVGDQQLSKHVDCIPCFEDGIAMISLCQAWEMVFKRTAPKDKQIRRLEVGSLAVLLDDARYVWTHEIPKRKSEPTPSGERIPRKRRVSLTFRRVRV